MIDVALVTWPNHPLRLQYFTETVDSLRKHLRARTHDLRYVCSAEKARDPESEWMGVELADYCATYDINLHWRHAAPNLGANMNNAIRLCTARYILVQQDDWRLEYPLDLSPGVDFMGANPAVDMIRYCWPDNDRMRPTFISQPDGWRRIDMRGKWPYGDEPHLQRCDFTAKWGEFLEGGKHASASSALMSKLRLKGANIRVADKNYYQHFGQISSYPRDQEQREGRRRE